MSSFFLPCSPDGPLFNHVNHFDMKTKLFLAWIFLCFTTAATAQKLAAPESNPFTSQADQVYSELDKSAITTDILYDRVFPYANLREFNQTIVDTSRALHYYIAYAELQQADYTSRWSTVNSLKNAVKALPEDQIPVGFINVDFNYFDEGAIQNNQLTYNLLLDKLQDVPGRSPDPYLTERALVASTLRDYTTGLTVSIITNDAYNMVAASRTIQTIQADFGNGYITLPSNGSTSVTFSNGGLKTIKYKITYTDNGVEYTYSTLRVIDTSATVEAGKNARSGKRAAIPDLGCTPINQTIEFSSNYGFQGYDETTSYRGGGEYRIYRGGNAVDNPVIVVDGFDPFEGENGGKGVTDIYDDFDQNGTGISLVSDNYDIIPLNFTNVVDNGKLLHGGTDYIERNAMTLITLIEAINDCKAGNNPIKVVGFSMGGLIARYALAYMEANNMTHDVDLFVSVDSPHQGAVVPIGIQEAAELIDDIIPGGDVATTILDTPAAKQLLVHHYRANSKTPVGAPGFHDRFFNDLNALGFPEDLRNISVVNGVSTGLNNNPIGGRYVDLVASTGILLPGLRIKAKLDYTPDRGLTRNAFDFIGQVRFLGVYITVFKRIRQATTIFGRGSYENTPGGFFDVESLVGGFVGDLNDTFDNFLLELFIADVNIQLIDPNFSFIPVKSALAFIGSVDLYEDFSQRNLVCTGETPFDSYFTEVGLNEEHIVLNGNSSEFMRQEILGNPQLPNAPFTSIAIEGPDTVCANDIVTYELSQCVGTNADMWTVSTNLTIETSDLMSVTVSVNNANGAAFVSAEVAGQTVTKNIWLGNAGAPTFLNGPVEVDTGGEYTYTGGGAPGATHYEWILPYPFDPAVDVRNPFDFNGANWQMYPEGNNASYETITAFSGMGGHNGLVQIVAFNQCSGIYGGGSRHLEVEHTNNGSCTNCNSPITVVPAPNPANDFFQLDFTSQDPGVYDIYLYDSLSVIHYYARVSNDLVTVDTSGLPTGVYFLHIYFPGEVTQQQVIVQH